MIERLLDCGISDQDKVTEFEVILDDGGGMLLFETDHSFDLCSVYVGSEHCQVGPMFLQGDSTPSNKVSRGKRGIGQRKKVCCFSNVKGQKRMHAGCCKVQVTLHTLVDCDSVSPHDRGDDRMQPRLVSITGLE